MYRYYLTQYHYLTEEIIKNKNRFTDNEDIFDSWTRMYVSLMEITYKLNDMFIEKKDTSQEIKKGYEIW